MDLASQQTGGDLRVFEASLLFNQLFHRAHPISLRTIAILNYPITDRLAP